MRRPPVTIDRLPLFASDEDIGEALLGVERKKEFTDLAASLERFGMPKIFPATGLRYVPAVKAYFDHVHGMRDRPPRSAERTPDHATQKQRFEMAPTGRGRRGTVLVP